MHPILAGLIVKNEMSELRQQKLLVNALLPRENNAEGKLAGECLLLLMDCPPLKYTS